MGWLENPYWQYFCGETYFQTTLPLHYTSLGKWRLRIGAEKLKLVLEETIRLAKEKKFVSDKDLSRVVEETFVAGKEHAEDFWQSCQHFSVTNCKSHEHRASRWSALPNFYGTFIFTA